MLNGSYFASRFARDKRYTHTHTRLIDCGCWRNLCVVVTISMMISNGNSNWDFWMKQQINEERMNSKKKKNWQTCGGWRTSLLCKSSMMLALALKLSWHCTNSTVFIVSWLLNNSNCDQPFPHLEFYRLIFMCAEAQAFAIVRSLFMNRPSSLQPLPARYICASSLCFAKYVGWWIFAHMRTKNTNSNTNQKSWLARPFTFFTKTKIMKTKNTIERRLEHRETAHTETNYTIRISWNVCVVKLISTWDFSFNSPIAQPFAPCFSPTKIQL